MADTSNYLTSVPSAECTDDETGENHPLDSISLDKPSNFLFESNSESLVQLIEAFHLAESDIKSSEVIDKLKHGLLVPSINELRYCSYHMIKALESRDENDQKDQLNRAYRHCQRASYDALELGLSLLIISINKIKETHRQKNVVISTIIDTYHADLSLVADMQVLLGSDYKDKQENFVKVREALVTAKSIFRKFEEADHDISVAHNTQKRTLNVTRFALVASLIIGAAAWFKILVPIDDVLTEPVSKQPPISDTISSIKSRD